MDYQKFKMATGCLIPCVLFVVAAAAVFVPMFTHETGYGLWTIGAPLLTGLCAAIVAVFLSRPLHHWMLTRELKNENSRVRLAAWQSDDPAVEFYASADGIWF
ncbi:MAG: hypothetical protein KJ668_13030, partial [Proteobacteria bacterium]|nr:hypothetical protein [Pseudomonadota bacterium]